MKCGAIRALSLPDWPIRMMAITTLTDELKAAPGDLGATWACANLVLLDVRTSTHRLTESLRGC